MTVSASYAPLVSAGNDATTEFSPSWPFFSSAEIKVTLISSAGVETVKSLTTHYTVSGGTDSNGLPATGTITMLTAPATGETLVIERVTTNTQATSYANNDAFGAKTHEAAYDRRTLVEQEAKEIAGRALQANPKLTLTGRNFKVAGSAVLIKWDDATGFYTYEAAPGEGDMLQSTYDPAVIEEQLVGLTATQTLTNKTLTQPTITLKQSAAPAPTAEGDIQWDTDDNKIKIGDGASTKTFSDDSYNAATYQPLDAGLTDIAALAVTDGNIIVGDGANWVAESGATARTSLGLGTGDSPTFTGAQIGDGSVGTPSLRFSSDTDNGLYRSSTNLWHLVGGGAPLLTVDGVNGRIGIGTTAPDVALHVVGSSGFIPIKFKSQYSGVGVLGTDNSSAYFGVDDAGDGSAYCFRVLSAAITMWAAGTERARINASGNFGIGTSIPGCKLDVDGVIRPKTYTVATLPTVVTGGILYASDGRKAGEGAASGTGVLVFADGSNWIAVDTGATVAA